MNWRARISPRRLVIAAASARPFVRAAAVAGHEVVAADVFCDADTRRHAAQALQLPYANGGFDADTLRRRLFPLLAADVGFVYGSGFETQPELLDEIAQHCVVLGNTAETVRISKDPDRFFTLLAMLHIPCPETARRLAAAEDGWLRKQVGGSGGTHVSVSPHAGAAYYYQRKAPGRPCSLLFVADGAEAVAVGYNQQWLAPAPQMPYRYGGAVSQAPLPDRVRTGMLNAARRLTGAIGLRGLNSLDCMVEDEDFLVLEVNPRLSATFALYDQAACGAGLFNAHLRACGGVLDLDLPPARAQAHLIYYAPFDMAIPAALAWPEWVADIPAGAATFGAGEPLCTVTATAATADGAHALVQRRADELTQAIIQLLERQT